MRTTNHKLTCGVHVVFDVVVEECEYLLTVNLCFYTGNQDVDNVFLDLCQHLLVLVKLVMLCRYHNGIDTLGDACIAVLDGYLAL